MHYSEERLSPVLTVPHYAYLKLKMPGPLGIITISGNTERSLHAEEYVAALAAEWPLQPE